MMAGLYQPTREDIDSFLSLVPGIPEAEVISRLKGNNNNVEQAIGEYFDNAGSGNKENIWQIGYRGPSLLTIRLVPME
jgi:hypothetical protein